jgi:hypothetical protein
LGERFGGEAFFLRKRFFCHFHVGSTLMLETFVWDKFTQVVNAIPEVIPHPQYGAYGWVRLKISSRADLAKAKKLIEMSHQYMISTKRISIQQAPHIGEAVKVAKRKFPNIRFRMKRSQKRLQIIMEARNFENSVEAGTLLNQAANYLRKA